MDFAFSDEQNDLRELARKILEDQVTNERLKDIEAKTPVHDSAVWHALAEAHLLGVAVPEAHGGMGYGFFELCLLLQELGRSVAPVPGLASLALGALPLARYGSDPQQARWLPGVTRGDVVLSAALIELEQRDPFLPETRFERAGDGFRLTGRKALVPAAELADAILVPARSSSGEVALLWVDPRGEGVQLENQASTNRQPHSQLTLDGAPVPADALLGDSEAGAEILRFCVQHASVALCAMQLGVSERALEMTAEYGRERTQFDRPIGSFQAVHQRAADAYINVEAIRLTTWEAAWLLSQSREASDAISIAKYWAAEGGQFTAYAAQHLHGGIGIDVDYPLHRYFLWAIQIEHTLGNARDQLAQLGERMATAS